MPRRFCGLFCLAVVLCLPASLCHGQKLLNKVEKQQARYSLSLDLEFIRKNGNPLEGTLSVLFGADPNAYATGFLVGDGLVITAYHAVSGNLSDSKKINLGFKPGDELLVRIYVKGCRANVIAVDPEGDLALLEICSSKASARPTFQPTPGKDEKLLLIARPNGATRVSNGTFYGSYSWRGQEYWSAKIESRDGYSGSPVYNQKAEVVGVFTGYDRINDVAVISPAIRAQKLLDDYMRSAKP
jgi:S1-C subfamily serine protease